MLLFTKCQTQTFVLYTVVLIALATSTENGFAQQAADRQGRIYRWTGDKIALLGPIPKDLPNEGLLVASEKEVAAEKRIGDALTKQVSLKVEHIFLADAISEVRKQIEVPLLFDIRSLEAGGFNAETTPVTLIVKDVSLQSLLDLLLHPVGLSWVIRNEALHIVSQREADERLITRIYPVQDLLLVNRGDHYTREGFELLTTIKESVSPQTWADTGGTGSALVFGDLIVVTQSREVHQTIANLLRALRKTRELEAPTTESRTKVYQPTHSSGGGSGMF